MEEGSEILGLLYLNMIFRNLTSDGDFCFGQGIQNYTTKDDAIKLNIKTRILSWKNDCFFAVSQGIDWYSRLGYKNQFNLLQQDLSNMILKSEGVTSLISFNAYIKDRTFFATYNITTAYSPSVIATIERNT